MKRILLSTVLVAVIICNLFVVPVMVSAETPFTVPVDWKLIGYEDFNGASGNTLASAYTSASSVPLITGSWVDTSTAAVKPTVNSITGELDFNAKQSLGTVLKGTLASPIDLSVDADYYLMMDCTFPNWNYTGITAALGYDDTAAAKYRKYTFGTYQNNSVQAPRITPTNPGNGNEAAYYGSQKARTYKWGAMQTMLVQISCRSTSLDTMKLRFFDDESAEQPSFTPDFWDIEHQVDLTGFARFDDFWFSAGNNSGTVSTAKLDNIYLYKAAPMSGYTTTGTVYGASAKSMVGDVVAPPLRVPTTISPTILDLTSTITFDAVPAKNAVGVDQRVVSQGWYNYSENPPVLLSNTNSYNVDASIVGKLLKAVVVVETGEGDQTIRTTYSPFTGYIRGSYDYTNLSATLYKGATKVNPSLATSADWAAATKLDFTSNISRNHNGNAAFSGTVAMIVAQYASDGTLKSVIKTPATTRLGGLTINSTLALTVSVPINQAPVNYASGDYFKTFTWMSDVNTNGGFAYDLLIPLPFNANCVSKVDRVDVPLN